MTDPQTLIQCLEKRLNSLMVTAGNLEASISDLKQKLQAQGVLPDDDGLPKVVSSVFTMYKDGITLCVYIDGLAFFINNDNGEMLSFTPLDHFYTYRGGLETALREAIMKLTGELPSKELLTYFTHSFELQAFNYQEN